MYIIRWLLRSCYVNYTEITNLLTTDELLILVFFFNSKNIVLNTRKLSEFRKIVFKLLIYHWTSMFVGTSDRAADWVDCSTTWQCSECGKRESSCPKPTDNRHRRKSSQDSKLRRPYDKCRSCHHWLSISKQQLRSSLKLIKDCCIRFDQSN